MKQRWFVGALLLLMACGNKGKEDDGGILDLEVETLPMPTALSVTWSTAEQGAGFVEYGLDGAFDERTAEGPAGTSHEATLVLLKANQAYQVRAVTLLDDGTRLESEPVTVEIAPPPQRMPRVTVNLSEPGAELPEGYLLTTTLGAGPSFVGIFDGDGDWVWWAEMDTPDLSSARAHLSRDGRSVLYNSYQTNRKADQGWLVRLSLDGREEVRTRTLMAHHDFVELPNGQIAWLGFEQDTVEVAGEPSNGEIGDGPHPLTTDVIYEAPEGIGEGDVPDRVWGFFDGFPAEPWWVCSHMEDLAHSFVPGTFEWTHTNSLAYVEEDDSYYILSRYLDALLKVDRQTGSLVWQLGGDHATLDLVEGEPFNHPHVSDVWDGGMLLFDNRDHGSGASRVVELSWDEIDGTARVEWEYARPDGAKLPILGDARRLPGGNRLIAWSARGEIAEVTPSGQVVFRMGLPLGNIVTRTVYFTRDDLTFR